jgi:hypothetical protein
MRRLLHPPQMMITDPLDTNDSEVIESPIVAPSTTTTLDSVIVRPMVGGMRGDRLSTNAFVGIVVGWVAIMAVRPWGDNSALTHLETGRRILAGTIPRSDPYTFTAHDASWTVQSWLPSAIMALFERFGAEAGVGAFKAILIGSVAAMGWTLCATSNRLMTRAVVLIPFLAIGQSAWSERPLMVGLVCIGAVLLAVDDRLPHWALIPIGWLWVNSHGSFALAPLLIGAIIIGEIIDSRRWNVPSLRVGLWTAAGILSGVVGPLGVATLRFPLMAARRASVFRAVVEWQAPDFTSGSDRWFLLTIALGLASNVVRPSWRSALVVCLTTGLALTSQRNIAVASMCTIWVAAASFDDLGSFVVRLPASRRMRTFGWLLASMLVVALGWTTGRLGVGGYPVASIEHLGHRTTGRVAAPDFVGNYLTAAYRGQWQVMFDDRVDALPDDVVDDELALLRATPQWRDVLARSKIDTVLWDAQRPLAALLANSDDWDIVWTDGQWIIAERVTR